MMGICRNEITIQAPPDVIEDLVKVGTQEPVHYKRIVEDEKVFSYEHFLEHEELTNIDNDGEPAIIYSLGTSQFPNLYEISGQERYGIEHSVFGCSTEVIRLVFDTDAVPSVRGTFSIANWLDENYDKDGDYVIYHTYYNISPDNPFHGIWIHSPRLGDSSPIVRHYNFDGFIAAEDEDELYTKIENRLNTPRLLLPQSFRFSVNQAYRDKPHSKGFACFGNPEDYITSKATKEYGLLPFPSLNITELW